MNKCYMTRFTEIPSRILTQLPLGLYAFLTIFLNSRCNILHRALYGVHLATAISRETEKDERETQRETDRHTKIDRYGHCDCIQWRFYIGARGGGGAARQQKTKKERKTN